VHANLCGLLLKLGRVDEAMFQLNEAARLAPDDPRYQYLLGKTLLRQGRSKEAVEHLEAALRLNPEDLKTLVYLARVLAADTDPAVRNGAKAVELAERANAMAGGEQAFVLDTLAIAYAESGRFAESRQRCREAIEKAKAAGDTEAVTEMQTRLQLYESGHPYREVLINALPEQMSK
jgi:tetratricopeptide (TPR) repeat protein